MKQTRRTAATFVTFGAMLLMTIPWVAWSDSYYQLEPPAGAPGNGFSVTRDGELRFGGALHMNVPCAYTPAQSSWVAAHHTLSHDSSIRFALSDRPRTNSTAFVGAGLGKPGNSLYLAFALHHDSLSRNHLNLQWQATEDTERHPAVAVGVLDVFDNVSPGKGRSMYLTVTRRFLAREQPVYATVGFGGGAFDDSVFGGVMFYPQQRLALGLEYAANAWTPHLAWQVTKGERWSGTVNFGWRDFDRPVLGFSVSH